MNKQTPPAVTIIIPAYNAEKTVETAVKSLLAQTFTDFEAIIIEDGSTDHTREILKKLEASDSRIRVIYKDKNEGLSAGRNSGIRAAVGTYLGFLDADDWIEPTLLETVYSKGIRQNSDLILFGYSHDTMDAGRTRISVSRKVFMEEQTLCTKEEIIKAAAVSDTHKLFAYSCTKLYRRQLIVDHGLSFPRQTLIEDFIFNCQFWNLIRKLTILDSTGYHYIKASSDALTQKFLPDYYEIIDLRYQNIRSLIAENGLFHGEISEQLANVHIKHLLAGMIRDCSDKSGYTRSDRLRRIRSVLNSESAKEAASLARGHSRQEIVCNFVFKSHCPWLNLLFFLDSLSDADTFQCLRQIK